MNLKERKEIAKAILREASKKEDKVKFKASLIGMEFNEKGNFYSLIMEVEANYKTEKGSMNLVKNIPLPVSLTQDMEIVDPADLPKKRKTVSRKELTEKPSE